VDRYVAQTAAVYEDRDEEPWRAGYFVLFIATLDSMMFN
jgi:hypothetical protein